ncbi:C-type LECtin [Trichostrongylus colubriformis]|uniref:C-type LECtin n=1 Tax=Trichostrongylus colubriformis TaxID=6319 RepID=A0AAN8F985_TRICO
MLFYGVALLLALIYVSALKCPSGYTEGDNDICYKVYTNHTSYFTASATCETNDGRLASIHNAYTNAFIQQMAMEADVPVWLGLKCSDTVAKNCQWDDGQGPSYPYDAFYPGNPSIMGNCVLMMIGGTASGTWISGDCNNMQIGFVCQVSKHGSCGDFTEFGGKCYRAFDQQLSMAAAESSCAGSCGHIASIHSDDENSMIATMLGAQSNYAMIGLVRQNGGSYNWTDHTDFDFNNFGNNNSAFGECVAISLVNELVAVRKWITVSCAQPLPFVCKREMGSCERTTTPSVVTLAPSTCDTPQFFEGNGTFYSPSYPGSYQGANPCLFIMTVDPADHVQIHFIDIQLSNGSSLELYNGFVDTVPFTVITSDVPSSTYYASSSNVMKMIYRVGNQSAWNQFDRWEAEFLPKGLLASTLAPVTVTGSPNNPSHCNQMATVPANITSPGYPGNYPALTQCRYQLSTTPGNKILLTFGEIDTEQCCDIISVYDYDGSPYDPLLDRFSGQIAAGVKVFTSSLNQMLVEFYTDSITQRSGFSATAVGTS